MLPSRLLHLLRQPRFDKRLIGHVALVGSDLDALEQTDRHAQRDRRRRRFQIGKARTLRLAPIDIVGAVMRFPEFALLGLVCKRGQGLKLLRADPRSC